MECTLGSSSLPKFHRNTNFQCSNTLICLVQCLLYCIHKHPTPKKKHQIFLNYLQYYQPLDDWVINILFIVFNNINNTTLFLILNNIILNTP